MRLLAAVVGIAFLGAAQAGQCVAESGAHTTALVELYTAEGCSSCPPADRWLSSLGPRGYAPARVVPIALHVDYRDYVAWSDPNAKRDVFTRQRKLTQLQRLALVYTPQVMLQGREFRGWGTAAFDQAVARINARPARARLRLEIISHAPDMLEVAARAEATQDAEAAVLYLAAYAGRLPHGHVVLEWQGPLPLAGQALSVRRWLPLLPLAIPAGSGVAAFVQDRDTAEVLQALMRPAC
jgi:hypothetical protein